MVLHINKHFTNTLDMIGVARVLWE